MRANRVTHPYGQGLVEFAIIIPVLILLLLVITDLGRITYTYSALHNAAREGARYGVVHPTDISGIEARTREYAIALDQDELTVVPLHNSSAQTIEVTAVYSFRTATPILNSIGGVDSFTLEAVSLMYTEE